MSGKRKKVILGKFESKEAIGAFVQEKQVDLTLKEIALILKSEYGATYADGAVLCDGTISGWKPENQKAKETEHTQGVLDLDSVGTSASAADDAVRLQMIAHMAKADMPSKDILRLIGDVAVAATA